MAILTPNIYMNTQAFLPTMPGFPVLPAGNFAMPNSIFSMPMMPSFQMPMFPMMPMFQMPMMPSFGFGFASQSSKSSSASENKSQGYNSNALSELKNASIFKGVPEDRKSKILDVVDRACKKYNVDPKFVLSIMYNESRFNPNAKSPCGAMGLMQLMPATAKSHGVKNAFDIEQNIMGGVQLLSKLLKRYNGNTTLAAAAYNAGPGRVKDKVPAIRETQNYVAKVNSTMKSLA